MLCSLKDNQLWKKNKKIEKTIQGGGGYSPRYDKCRKSYSFGLNVMV